MGNSVSGRGNSITEALRWRKDWLGWSVVMEEDREVSRAAWGMKVFGFYSKGSGELLKGSEKGLT